MLPVDGIRTMRSQQDERHLHPQVALEHLPHVQAWYERSGSADVGA
jgi:hypothetical protein